MLPAHSNSLYNIFDCSLVFFFSQSMFFYLSIHSIVFRLSISNSFIIALVCNCFQPLKILAETLEILIDTLTVPIKRFEVLVETLVILVKRFFVPLILLQHQWWIVLLFLTFDKIYNFNYYIIFFGCHGETVTIHLPTAMGVCVLPVPIRERKNCSTVPSHACHRRLLWRVGLGNGYSML